MKGGGAVAREDEDDRRIADELRRGGCPEDVISEVVGVQDGGADDYEIWPENADALRAFLFCETQWNVLVGGLSGVHWMGIKYEAAALHFRLHPPADEPDAWEALRMIESEAVRLRNDNANS